MTHKRLLLLIIVVLMGLSLCFIGIQPVCTDPETYLFTTTLLVPINNSDRVKHAQVIAHELPKIGIQVNLLLYGWDIILSRTFDPPGPLALSYANGGYDMACFLWTASLIPEMQYWRFHSTHTPDPNYLGVQNTTLDEMLEFTVNTTDIAQRKQYLEDVWQYLTWGLQAEIALYQTESVVYMRDNVKGYSCDRRVPGPLGVAEMYFEDGVSQGHGRVNEFIMASTTRPSYYNDFIEISWYNQMAIGQLNHGMVERDPDYNFIPVLLTQLPYPVAIENNHTGIVSPTDPNFATVWEIELRDDVYWHEGYGYNMTAHNDTLKVDADDVVWTCDLILNDSGPNPCYNRGEWQILLGDNASLSVIKEDRYHVQFHLKMLEADLLTYFEQRLFPQHILALGTTRADGSVAPSYADWHTDDWNLGYRTGGYTGPAVIGNGPYILWPGENAIAQTVTEEKNPYWFLKDEPAYANIFDKYIYTWIANKNTALNLLELGNIDLMDIQFHAEKEYPVMKNKPGIFVQEVLDWGIQTMGINTAYGTGGLTDYRVRLAISHMCPRQDMTDYLLGGLGQPAFMCFPQQSPFYPAAIEPIVYNHTRAIEYMEAAGYDMTPYKSPYAPDTQETSNDDFFATNLVGPDGPFGSLTSNGVATPGPPLAVEVLVVCVVMSSMTVTVLVYRYRQRKQGLRVKEEI